MGWDAREAGRKTRGGARGRLSKVQCHVRDPTHYKLVIYFVSDQIALRMGKMRYHWTRVSIVRAREHEQKQNVY